MAFTVEQVLEWTQGRLVNEDAFPGWAAVRVERPAASLAESVAAEVAFFFSKAYQDQLAGASPGMLITGEPFVEPLKAAGVPLWGKTAVIACADPYRAMARVSRFMAPGLSSGAHPAGAHREATAQVHPSAVIGEAAELGPGVRVGANCVIEAGARIGAGTVLYPNCYVGAGVETGEDCVLFPGVAVYERSRLGARVRVHANSVIGSDGFGYAPVLEDGVPVGHEKIYHLGGVSLGDDVEVGASTSVDRGTFGDTVIERNAKLDNQVQIGHNARVEEGGVICGGTALAGNARVGRYAYVGGLTGIANHVYVREYAKVGALSLVTKDVPPGETAVGNPQRTHKEHFRAHGALNKLIRQKKTTQK